MGGGHHFCPLRPIIENSSSITLVFTVMPIHANSRVSSSKRQTRNKSRIWLRQFPSRLTPGTVGAIPIHVLKVISFDWCSYLRFVHECAAEIWRERRVETKEGGSFGMGPLGESVQARRTLNFKPRRSNSSAWGRTERTNLHDYTTTFLRCLIPLAFQILNLWLQGLSRSALDALTMS